MMISGVSSQRSLWNVLNRLTCFKKKRLPSGIYSVEEFRAILKRERARVDRSGGRVSLVLFDMNPMDEHLAIAHRLAEVLTHRKRSTDEVGWFDNCRIGVVLPGTPAESALNLAVDINQKINTGTPSLAFKVYVYPYANPDTSPPDEIKGNKARLQSRTTAVEGLEPLLVQRMTVWKRGIDFIGGVFGLLLLFPVFLLIAILIKIVSPGPVFFKQERIGYLGRPFTLWKFRTMRGDADTSAHQQYLITLIHSDEAMIKLDENGDQRVFPLGNFLRQSGLDELPQLINVIRGEMSLIGPRPCIPYEVQEYQLWHKNRFDAVPGLTGLWQVSGKNKVTFNEMIRLDIKYAKERSLWLELRILVKTLPVITMLSLDYLFDRKGEAYAGGH